MKKFLISIVSILLVCILSILLDQSFELPFGLRINLSSSLPYTVLWSQKIQSAPCYGQLVAFTHPLSKHLFLKEIVGLPKDEISICDQQIYINQKQITLDKNNLYFKQVLVGSFQKSSPSGFRLSPVKATIIPANTVFVRGTHLDSFDSRYEEFGLIPIDQIKEELKALF